ncbi:MAG: hypothetical protein VX519_12715 [Myxococcota bacterium]|nr:hypothetical protein [Myxococcota bacterium]
MSQPLLGQHAADPYAGDSWFPDLPSNFQNHLSYTPSSPLSLAEYNEEDERFFALYRSHLSGNPCLNDLVASAKRLGVSDVLKHDRRPARVAPIPIQDSLLCDILENEIPDLLPIASDTILGPFSDAHPSPALLRAVIAAISHSSRIDSGQHALTRWHRHSPGEDPETRAAIRCLERIPAMLWSLNSPQSWTPLLPLSAAYHPRIRPRPLPIASLSICEPEAVVARVLPVADGTWVAIGAIGLPAAPPSAFLQERLLVELIRYRRHERRANWEDLLRLYPEVLYRTCATWCWHHLEELT